MQGLAQGSKNLPLLRKGDACSKGILTQNLSVTLPVLSTLNEKDCKPFWNQRCATIQPTLWLPQKTGSHDQDSNLSSGSLNYQEDKSKFWMTRMVPVKPLISMSLSVSLPRSATATTESVPLKGAKIVASKRIRIYPENEPAYRDALALYRRSYNLAVERFRNDKYKDENGKFINMRPSIKAQVEKEQKDNGRAYNSIISDNGTLAAATTFKSVCSKNKKLKGASGGFSEISFKSRKGSRHSFSIDRLPKGLNPCVNALGRIHLTEEVPAEAIGKSCVITCDKGRWFIQVQQHIELNADIQGAVKCVGIDPGVRTFATCFSDKEALIAGNDFAKEKLFPLMKRVDNFIGQKQKILNTQKGIKFPDMPQWAQDRIVNFDKEINRLKCKKDDIILDLHNRLAFELVSNYDVIFLPSFETRGMVTRKDKKVRTIRRNTCRQMLDLNHYGFKVRLKWYARKYGKHVVDCNEAYTSKTRSWDGSIDDRLGSSKVIKGNGFTVDRDINGARNVLLKNLTRQLEP
ncbi:RNA-guided endonuclease TnpB family protein [Endozoicomonas euniceicola]|uniref:RNA-guided endonuclease TnpB family protein n=2 Tax=Endozoicomonas euniceicola TaxID=1234143 RepID=A0ABY6GWS8_9GAMM|nr:RNA-guided endonuclease TnpB family protein [Endozoicomonas euniceicola]UYM17226.1 RNA-guided endonuclease TnpB family protein [Endozoicomonas euniceicola]